MHNGSSFDMQLRNRTARRKKYLHLLAALAALWLALPTGTECLRADGLSLEEAQTSASGPFLQAADSSPADAFLPAPAVKPAFMLARVYQPEVDVSIYWVSEKLDGVRAHWDGRRLIMRGGSTIQAPAWFTAGFPPVPLDGELWAGRGTFEEVSGTVRRQQPDEAAWRRVRYMVFDMPDPELTFDLRLDALRALLDGADNPHIQVVKQFRLEDHAALMDTLEQVAAAGGEGLMLHRAEARHRAGRSDDLLKLKPYLDAEARVVGHLPGKGKYTGMLGALQVQTGDGRRFAIGTGLSDAQRLDPPPVGSIVTYQYQGLTSNGIPRFASFLRVRTSP